ncbi:MAG: DUF4249 family protein [Cyclobacteriaceae bacterium]
MATILNFNSDPGTRVKRIDFFLKFPVNFLVLLSSCLTPIDFPVEIKGGTLVVTGQISTISDQNIIQLGRTANTARLPFPLSGATIQLFDDVGNAFLYEEAFQNAGTYYLKNIAGVAGRIYYIQIDLIEGGSYKSIPEKLPEPSMQESVYYEIVKKKLTDGEGAVLDHDYMEIFSSSRLLSFKEPNYLKWEVEEAFLLSPTNFPGGFGSIPPPCFVVQNADPQRIVLFDGSQVSSTTINNLLVGSRLIDWSFLERHYFTIYQSSITKEAYDYWRKVNIVANQVGTIFDAPPAVIIGNIVCEGNPEVKTLGYFQAVNQIFKRFEIYATDLPFPLTVTTCGFTGSYDPLVYPKRCIDCTSLRNSSYTRPVWW